MQSIPKWSRLNFKLSTVSQRSLVDHSFPIAWIIYLCSDFLWRGGYNAHRCWSFCNLLIPPHKIVHWSSGRSDASRLNPVLPLQWIHILFQSITTPLLNSMPFYWASHFVAPKYPNLHFLLQTGKCVGPSTRLRTQKVCQCCKEYPFVVLHLRGSDRGGKEIVSLLRARHVILTLLPLLCHPSNEMVVP